MSNDVDEDDPHEWDCECLQCECERLREEEEDLVAAVEDVSRRMKAGTLWGMEGNETLLMLALEDCPPFGPAEIVTKVLVLDGDFVGERGVVVLYEADLQYLEQYFRSVRTG